MSKEDKNTKNAASDLFIENITGNEFSETEEDINDDLNVDDEFFSGLADDLEEIAGLEEPEEKKKSGEEVEEEEETKEAPKKEEPAVDPELEELKKYKDFVPLLEVMMNDPNLVQLVKNYLTGEQSETKEPAGEFEIPEDFIFDFEEAIKNPESDSGKLLNKYVQMQVHNTVKNELSKEQQQRVLDEQKKAVMKKFGATEQDVDDLIRWSMNTPLTLEDAYYLKNRAKIEKEIARNAINSALKKKSKSHRSLSHKGKPGTSANPEDDLFSVIQSAIEFGGGVLG